MLTRMMHIFHELMRVCLNIYVYQRKISIIVTKYNVATSQIAGIPSIGHDVLSSPSLLGLHPGKTDR